MNGKPGELLLISVASVDVLTSLTDLLKGSFYANPLMDDAEIPEEKRAQFPEYYGYNIWPESDDVAGFEDAFKALGS